MITKNWSHYDLPRGGEVRIPDIVKAVGAEAWYVKTKELTKP
jgi:hypothetical protein